jgi:hypothetical protein
LLSFLILGQVEGYADLGLAMEGLAKIVQPHPIACNFSYGFSLKEKI